MSFTSRKQRSLCVGTARLVGGYAARAASDAIPALADEARLVRFSFEDSRTRYVGEMEDAAETTVFGSRALALRGAPYLGSALGFALGFCLSLPLVARASLEQGGETFLPKRIGKLFAWYASLRRTTSRVPANPSPPTCHQRALAARDAWRWAHAILTTILVIASGALRLALTPREGLVPGGTAPAKASTAEERAALLPQPAEPLSGEEDSLVDAAALCVDAALIAAQLVGATVLQVGLRLPPRDAAISVIIAYAGLVPAAAGLLGAVCLRFAASPRAPSSQQHKKKKHRLPRPNLVLLRDAPLPPPEKKVIAASSRVRPRSLSAESTPERPPPPPPSSEPSHRHKRRLSSGGAADYRSSSFPSRAAASFLLRDEEKTVAAAAARPERRAKAFARRRAARALALAFVGLAASFACVVATLWSAGESGQGALAPALVYRRDVGARLALASFGAVCAALPSFAVLAPPRLLASPRASVFRALPFIVGGLAVRHVDRSRTIEDVPPPDDNKKACREFPAPPDFRIASRNFISFACLALLSLAAALLAASLCVVKPPGGLFDAAAAANSRRWAAHRALATHLRAAPRLRTAQRSNSADRLATSRRPAPRAPGAQTGNRRRSPPRPVPRYESFPWGEQNDGKTRPIPTSFVV